MSHTRSRGSILGFVIVGLLLLGLIAGAVYAVRNGMLNGGNAPEIAQEDKTNDSPVSEGANQSDNQDKPAEQKTDELSEALKKQAEAEKKAKDQSQSTNTQTPSTSQPSTTSQPSSSSETKTTTTPTTSTTPSTLATTGVSSTHLPQTGPREDATLMFIGASLVAGAVVAYRRSRALI